MTTEVLVTNKNKKRKAVVSDCLVSRLPDEIIVEVLLRLPPKAILRFRAVCRSWAALLSSDKFCSLHMAITEVAPAPPKLLFVSPTARFDSTAVYSCSPSGSGPRDDLLLTLDRACGNYVEVTPATCRGLTLLYDAIAPAYYIFNAATRAVTRLPPFRDATHVATAGLGFDAQTREYKVVRFISSFIYEKERIKCDVYTPGGDHGDRWRPAAGGVPFRLCRVASAAIHNAVSNKLPPVFANGFLHLLINPSLLIRRPRAAIISFSVTEETFRWVRSPPFLASEVPSTSLASGTHLVEMDSQLCMVRDLCNSIPDGNSLEIWKLLDYSSGDWSLNYRITLLGHVARDLLEPQIVVRVIGSIGNCRSGKKIIIATSKHKVHTYDPSSKALETILSRGSLVPIMDTNTSLQIKPPSLRFSLYEESLAPVHKTDEEIALSSTLAKATKEILLRLPAKSAIQSKFVCKQWLRLIESENFIQSYHKHKNMDKRPKVMLVGKGTGQLHFSFAPLNRWLQGAPSHSTLLDTKVVCSKPCHGLNLVSTKTKDYLYNPCTGFHSVYYNLGPRMYLPWRMLKTENHAFTVGNKNAGLGFNPLTREHVVVEIFHHVKDFESRQYYSTCALQGCRYMSAQELPVPPLPVSDMPPAYVEGMLYWMSDPRVGRSYRRAIVSFNTATYMFDVIPCPSCIATWDSTSPCRAFVVELEGVLCAVLADPVANNLDVWKLEHGQWGRAYTIHLKALPDYSLGTNVVVPLAVDPDDGRILLNTGRKIGLYDPVEQTIQNLYSLDQVPVATSTTPYLRACQGSHIENCRHSDFYPWKSSSKKRKSFDMPSTSTSLGNNLTCSKDQSMVELNGKGTEVMPFVPMLYEESLAYHPRVFKAR